MRASARVDVREATRRRAHRENRNANQARRFAQKTGFGERR
jgi:hypothetical protein